MTTAVPRSSVGGILVLGGGDGWHAGQLRRAAAERGRRIDFVPYESLAMRRGVVEPFVGRDAILTRTMPAGSFERVTFRLTCLRAAPPDIRLVNAPEGLEAAIDKSATAATATRLGLPVPDDRVCQDRASAMDAFEALGGDVVVKPIFGGEGRGVLRVRDPELAWTTFSTLEGIAAVHLVQRFVSPGGRDVRLLIVGDRTLAVRRDNANDFRTNNRHARGGLSIEAVDPPPTMVADSRRLMRAMNLTMAAVDWIEPADGPPMLLEVNAVPGWRNAQTVAPENVARWVIETLVEPESTP